jgi:polysaccharide biosynthesis transport protein
LDINTKQSHYSDFDRVTPRLVLKKVPFTPISEAYRMLLSNLRFLKSDQRLKTLVMTSSIAGEGKSTVTANLALAMVQQGFRVLLIDADMRRPMQHRVWELPQSKGLSDVLVGDVEVQEALHPVEEKLWVLTAGANPPNPSALLESAKMAELLHQFSQQYDYVLIDTPPLRAASETRSLGKNADGIVLIARPSVLELPNATFAKNLLQQTESQVLGLIANGIDTQQEPDSYYYYDTPCDTSSKLSQNLIKTL